MIIILTITIFKFYDDDDDDHCQLISYLTAEQSNKLTVRQKLHVPLEPAFTGAVLSDISVARRLCKQRVYPTAHSTPSSAAQAWRRENSYTDNRGLNKQLL